MKIKQGGRFLLHFVAQVDVFRLSMLVDVQEGNVMYLLARSDRIETDSV